MSLLDGGRQRAHLHGRLGADDRVVADHPVARRPPPAPCRPGAARACRSGWSPRRRGGGRGTPAPRTSGPASFCEIDAGVAGRGLSIRSGKMIATVNRPAACRGAATAVTLGGVLRQRSCPWRMAAGGAQTSAIRRTERHRNGTLSMCHAHSLTPRTIRGQDAAWDAATREQPAGLLPARPRPHGGGHAVDRRCRPPSGSRSPAARRRACDRAADPRARRAR